MGTWDVTVFGNDDAADFTGAITDARDQSQIVAALIEAMKPAINQSSYLDSYDGSVALAAAALVAAWDQPGLITEPSYTPEKWPPAAGPAPDDLKQMAHQTLARITSEDENELAQLWIEADNWDTFKADIARYAAALS